MLGHVQPVVTLPINEVYATVQGEATWTGTPAWFVRTQGCPVGCPFCDTKYTWELTPGGRVARIDTATKDKSSPAWAVWTLDALVSWMEREKGIRHVVFTGGEPCMNDLTDWTRELVARGYRVQIETSGTVEIRVTDDAWVTCSPKFDMPGGRIVQVPALWRANEIKFAVGRQRDIDRLRTHVVPFIRRETPVWLQPISQSDKATALCVRAATENGWRVSVQVHKYLGLP